MFNCPEKEKPHRKNKVLVSQKFHPYIHYFDYSFCMKDVFVESQRFTHGVHINS